MNWKFIKSYATPFILGVAVVLAVTLGNAKVDIDRSPIAAEMEKNPEQWFAKEITIGDFAKRMEAGEVAVVGTALDYALVTDSDDKHFYVRIDKHRAMFQDMLKVEALASPTNMPNVVSLGAVTAPKSPLQKVFGGVSTLEVLQLLSVSILVLFLVGTGILGGGREVKKASRPSTRLKDVIGCDEAKMAVQDIVAYLKNPKSVLALGAKPPRGLIMTGPAGTGKTLLAQALAGEAKCSYIAIDGSFFTDKFMGMGVKRVRKLFEAARKAAPCIIFIDEIDGLGTRGGDGSAGSTENNRIINALLTELDGGKDNTGVLVIGATNDIARLDPALRREGRFDRVCVVTLPDIEARESIFSLYLGQVRTAPEIDGRKLARLTAGVSPATIRAIVNDAALNAAKEQAVVVTQSHLIAALEQNRMGAAGGKPMSEDQRYRVAVHEAGHALVAYLLDMGVIEKVSILPRGVAGGVTWITQDADDTLFTEQRLNNQMAMLLGGRVAEFIALRDRSTGASDDLRRVAELAHSMVTQYGFGKTFGPLNINGLPGFAREEFGRNELAQSEIRKVIENAEATATRLLTENRHAFNELVELLMKEEVATGEDIERLTTPSVAIAA